MTVGIASLAKSIRRSIKNQGCCDQLKPTLLAGVLRVTYRVDGDRVGFYESSKDFLDGMPRHVLQAVADEIVKQERMRGEKQ